LIVDDITAAYFNGRTVNGFTTSDQLRLVGGGSALELQLHIHAVTTNWSLGRARSQLGEILRAPKKCRLGQCKPNL
jgi:hypothetical protein